MRTPSTLLLLPLAASGFHLSSQVRLTRSPRAGIIQNGLLNALRSLRKVEQSPQVEVGASLPEVDVEIVVSEGLAEAAGVANQAAEEGAPDRVTLSLAEAIGTEPTVLLGMPGAFTPSCTDIHLPGYINAEGKMEAKGVEQIALLTTNDVYTNRAWLKTVEECVDKRTRIAMISDGDGDALKALGLMADMGFGLGVRAQRFALVLDQGIVKHVAIDKGMKEVDTTSAEAVMEVLPIVLPKSEASKAEADQQSAGSAAALLAAGVLYYLYTSG